MDKREDDILDELLDGEIGEDPDEMKLPETLMGADTNEPAEPETDDAEPDIESELSKFLDDDDEDEKPSEDSKKSAKELDREEIEREIREKIAKEKKEKFKSAKKISIVCVAVAVVILAGLFVFMQINKAGNDYIMKFDGKKISVEEFKFFMLLNVLNQTSYEKQAAYDGLLNFLVLNKAAKEKNVVLSDEESDYVKSNAEYIKTYLEANNITIPDISDERLEEIIAASVSGAIYYKLLGIVALDAGYAVDENDFGAKFDAYLASNKLLKYIITQTEEDGEEAREALVSGLAADEAVKQYSTYYEMYGIETLNLSDLGFDEENYKNVMALKELEFSEVIDLGGVFAVFIAATYEETRNTFREQYIYDQQNQLFDSEYEFWKSEAKESMNEKVFENFDVDEFFETMFGG
ncbi:MAG: hypothetical protein FWG34_10835 [Oscillospiraceae bacterium]|nr:hypothetical protein [Oscillospiraceae bacterium]